MTNVVYLDNNATTQVAPGGARGDAALSSRDYYGNPSSMHSFGGRVAAHIRDGARAGGRACSAPRPRRSSSPAAAPRATTRPSARPSSPTPPSGTSSPRGWSTRPSRTCSKPWPRRATARPSCRWTARGGWTWTTCYDSLSDDTAIVSLMWANNETGVIFPVEEIAAHGQGARHRLPHGRGAGGRQDPDRPRRAPGSTCSRSPATSCTRPKGIGALYVRKGTKFAPFMIGGHQEQGRRGGTEKRAAIVGLGKAAELAAAAPRRRGLPRVSELRDRLEQGLLAGVPEHHGQRRPGAPAAQHHRASLRVRRGRGDPAAC